MKNFKFTIKGEKYEVAVDEKGNNIVELVVNGTPYTVELEEEVVAPAPSPKAAVAAATAATATASGSGQIINSPLPGSILKVLVTSGQNVQKGDILLTMESMKMENNIVAETNGVVGTIYVTAGQAVMQDDKLIEIGAGGAVASPAGGKGTPVKAALPGSIIKLVATEGQAVKKGEVVLTMESMKMENEVTADKDGVITKMLVAPGQSVLQDDTLFELA